MFLGKQVISLEGTADLLALLACSAWLDSERFAVCTPAYTCCDVLVPSLSNLCSYLAC